MTGQTLYPELEPLLAQIQKPIQYVGGELNAQVKAWDDAAGDHGVPSPAHGGILLRSGPESVASTLDGS